jgi:Multicopper oxidase
LRENHEKAYRFGLHSLRTCSNGDRGEMGSRTRRDFLKLSAASTLIFAHGADAGDRLAQPAYRKPGSLDRYVDVLRGPRRLLPYGTRVDRTLYRVRMFEFTQQMHSQLPPTKLWGYEGQYPGPIIEAQRGKPIEILWENHLPSDHIFAVDPRIHGAMPPAPPVRTVPHLHGSRTRSELSDSWEHRAHLRRTKPGGRIQRSLTREMCSLFWFGSRATPAGIFFTATCWNMKITT